MSREELYAALVDVFNTLAQDNISDTKVAQQMLQLLQIRRELDKLYHKVSKMEQLLIDWKQKHPTLTYGEGHEYYIDCLEVILNGT